MSNLMHFQDEMAHLFLQKEALRSESVNNSYTKYISNISDVQKLDM